MNDETQLNDNPASTIANLRRLMGDMEAIMNKRDALNRELADRRKDARRYGFDDKKITAAIKAKLTSPELTEAEREAQDEYTGIARETLLPTAPPVA